MKHVPKPNYERPSEQPRYDIPDRHRGHSDDNNVNGSYRQPWVEHDGVTDHEGHAKIG